MNKFKSSKHAYKTNNTDYVFVYLFNTLMYLQFVNRNSGLWQTWNSVDNWLNIRGAWCLIPNYFQTNKNPRTKRNCEAYKNHIQ